MSVGGGGGGASAAAASAAASRHARHARTRAHEVLLAALDALDALCAVREVARAEVMRVARASAPLLSRRQPDAVQAAALALHRRLAALNADAIWLVWAAVGGAAVEGEEEVVWAELRPVEDFAANAALALEGVAEVDRAAAAALL